MADLFYPVQAFAGFIVGLLLGGEKSALADALNFLIYDFIKIIILLFVMISVVGFLRTYLPKHRVREMLAGRRAGVGNLIASIFGAVTPFCSCSSIPVFIGFLEAGVPLGVNFSFLITSPLVNEYVAVIMLGFFGWEITALYVAGGILLGTVAGIALGKMGLEKYIEAEFRETGKSAGWKAKYKTFGERARFGLREGITIVKKIWLWVLLGIGAAAIIHGFVPEDAIHGIVNAGGIFAVPLATFIAVPLYANCAAVVPIAVVLFEKGVPLGTALAFMMGTAALSLPEAIMLKRVMKPRLVAIFFGTVALGIIITGYVFNALQGLLF
ncbi:permease [Candidatus Micrarchaeota archaeon]|nr:permease [Candidatus Micrarchaeota archaeon]MBU1939750.1 permease [Candidatus Micrarchaeota archaeon]